MIRLTRHKVAALQQFRQMSSSENWILLEEKDSKGIITINREKALNAINLDMNRKMYDAIKKWETTKNLVIIKGISGKIFSAGGDVRAVVNEGCGQSSNNFFRDVYTSSALIKNYKIPYIAFIDGITMGGAVGLAVHGKYRIATERTIIGLPETAIGLFPDVGGSYFLPRLNGKLGLYLGLSGARLMGKDVLKGGLATHFCDSTRLPELENELMKSNNENDVEIVLNKLCSPVDHQTENVLVKNIEQINKCFGATTVEGIVENLELDGSEWAQSTLKLLKKRSPTSLKVTRRQLEYGSKLNLTDCLKMEYRMLVHHLEAHDFKEGVRALLIDKDQQPKWNPKTLEEVSEDKIESYFKKLPDSDELKL